jgi:hypothetical protein
MYDTDHIDAVPDHHHRHHHITPRNRHRLPSKNIIMSLGCKLYCRRYYNFDFRLFTVQNFNVELEVRSKL